MIPIALAEGGNRFRPGELGAVQHRRRVRAVSGTAPTHASSRRVISSFDGSVMSPPAASTTTVRDEVVNERAGRTDQPEQPAAQALVGVQRAVELGPRVAEPLLDAHQRAEGQIGIRGARTRTEQLDRVEVGPADRLQLVRSRAPRAPVGRPRGTAERAYGGFTGAPPSGRRHQRNMDRPDGARASPLGIFLVGSALQAEVGLQLEGSDLAAVLSHSRRLLRRKKSNTCSPSASATSSDFSISARASARLPGSGL